MSFLDRVKHYIPGPIRNAFVAPYERRKTSLCPQCDYECDMESQTWGDMPQYIYECNRCTLCFRKTFITPSNDKQHMLQILATCPECKKNHAPQIYGPVNSDKVPCEPCWLKTNKPFDPDETQIILLPGCVLYPDENEEPVKLLLPGDDEEDTSEILLPAIYRK